MFTLVILGLGRLFFALRLASLPEGAEEREIDLEIRGDAMTPDEVTLREGDSVTLRVNVDRLIDFHLRGYDLEQVVQPDETSELSFEADLTGRFEIEDEQAQAELGTLIVEPQ